MGSAVQSSLETTITEKEGHVHCSTEPGWTGSFRLHHITIINVEKENKGVNSHCPKSALTKEPEDRKD